MPLIHVGIITNTPKKNVICDRCTIPLIVSFVNDRIISFSTSPRMSSGFLCAKCYAHSRLKTKKGLVIKYEEIKKYLQILYEEYKDSAPFVKQPEPEPEPTLDYECDKCGMRFNKNVGLSLHKTHMHKKKPMIIINNA